MYSVIDICIPDSIPMLLILVYEDYVLSIISRLNLKTAINESSVSFTGYETSKFT